MFVEVIRRYSGSGPAGTVYDTASWPANRANQLIAMRYVREVAGGPNGQPAELPPKRRRGRPRRRRIEEAQNGQANNSRQGADR